MLVECGFSRVQVSDGTEYSFTPSLARIAALGSPQDIVALYAALHGPQAYAEAGYVLNVLCDQDDPAPLVGWHDDDLKWNPGAMPPAEQIILARRLMHHGIVGTAKPGTGGSGKFSPTFNASEFVSFARVHLGLSSGDAESLSMTELHQMIALKFPEAADAERDVPSREDYDAFMARVMRKAGDGR